MTIFVRYTVFLKSCIWKISKENYSRTLTGNQTSNGALLVFFFIKNNYKKLKTAFVNILLNP